MLYKCTNTLTKYQCKFLTTSDHTYQQTFYQDIDEKNIKSIKKMPNVNFEKLSEYEDEDNTNAPRTILYWV